MGKELKDDDYTLVGDGAWVVVGGFAIRIHNNNQGVRITVCPDGREYTALDELFVEKEMLDADV